MQRREQLPSHHAHVVSDSVVIVQTLNRTQSDQSNVLVVESLLGPGSDVVLGDGLELGLDLSGGDSSAKSGELSSNVLGNVGGAVQRQKETSLELGLGSLNLQVGHGGGQSVPLLKGEVDEIVNLGGVLGGQVDSPQTGIGVRGGEGLEGVGQVVLGHNVGESRSLVGRGADGSVVVTDDGLGNEGGVVVLGGPGDTLNSNGNVGDGHGVVSESDLGSHKVGDGVLVGVLSGRSGGTEGNGGGGGREIGEVLLGELDEGVVVDGSGSNKHHSVGGVVLGDELSQLSVGDGLDVLSGTQNGSAQGLVHEGGGVQVVKDNLLVLLVDLLELSGDDLSFSVNGRLGQLGVLQNVGQNLHRLGHVVLERLGVVDGGLSRGVGVEVAAHVLNVELELVLGSLVGALEGQMLEKVSGSVVVGVFVSRAGVDPHSDGGGLNQRVGLGGNGQAVLEVGGSSLGGDCGGKTSLGHGEDTSLEGGQSQKRVHGVVGICVISIATPCCATGREMWDSIDARERLLGRCNREALTSQPTFTPNMMHIFPAL